LLEEDRAVTTPNAARRASLVVLGLVLSVAADVGRATITPMAIGVWSRPGAR